MRKLLILSLLLPPLMLLARKHTTGPTRLEEVKVEQTVEAADDTIWPRAGYVVFDAYSKPNGSNYETFRAINRLPLDAEITGLDITLTYTDKRGTILHTQRRSIPCQIPHGQGRLITIPTWDRNHAYHHVSCPPPRKKNSTPYRVTFQVDAIRINRL